MKDKQSIINWVKDYMETSGGKNVVIGLSGGKDSAVVAALCVEAVGKDNVYGVMMPNGYTEGDKDVTDAVSLAEHLGIKIRLVDISEAVGSMKRIVSNGGNIELSVASKINIPPRVRMTVLYGIAQNIGNCRVTCNSNLSEDTLGYATKFGDTAGDFAPIMHLTVREVVELGYDLGLPKEIVEKTPQDGLTGKEDEEVFGFSYEQLDKYILEGTSGDKKLDKAIYEKEKYSEHKIESIPTMKK